MKKFVYIILTFCIIFLISCSSEIQPEENNNQISQIENTTAQSDMWSVEILDAEKAESLTATMAAITYGGDLQETINLVEPGSGNVFLLIELTIEKIGTGKASFSWSDAHVEDSKGNVFFRMGNDTFISNLNIPRLKGTDIVLGTETGYVCFEIPMESSGLRFVADNGNIIIAVAI